MSNDWSPKVARAMHELSDSAPLPPSADALASHRPPAPRSRVGAAMAAVVIVIAAVVGLVALTGRDDGPAGPDGAATIEVFHARYTTRIVADLQCDNPVDTAGKFLESTIDLWADRTGRQWRTTTTYPDGSTYDVVRRGSAIYPTERFSRGEQADATVACALDPEPYRFVTPYMDGLVTLTVAAEITADEQAFVRLPEDLGDLVDGNAVDSLGRPTWLFEHRVSGGISNDGDLVEVPVTQVQRWWIDPADGVTVTESTFSDSVEGLGTVTSTATLVTSETIAVPADLFDTGGWTPMETGPRPDVDPLPTTETTAMASPTTADGITDTTQIAVDDCSAAVDLDLASEPPGWRFPEYRTWFRDGCVVRVDVITDRPGPDHCGWGSARVIVVGSPIGMPFSAPGNAIEYVRDPSNAFQQGFDQGYDPDASLPADAVDTGYRTDEGEAMWVMPTDDTYLYLVVGDRVEQWPQGPTPGCS